MADTTTTIRAYNAELLSRHWDTLKTGDLFFFDNKECAIVVLITERDILHLKKKHVCISCQTHSKDTQVYNISIEDMEEMDVSEDEADLEMIFPFSASEFGFLLEKEEELLRKNVHMQKQQQQHYLWNNGRQHHLTCFACLLQRYKNIPLLLESVDEFFSTAAHFWHRIFGLFSFVDNRKKEGYWSHELENDNLLNLLTGTSNCKGVRLVSLVSRVVEEDQKLTIRKLVRPPSLPPNNCCTFDIINFIEPLVNIDEFNCHGRQKISQDIPEDDFDQLFWSSNDTHARLITTIQTSMTAGEFCVRALQSMKILRTPFYFEHSISCHIFHNSLTGVPHSSKKHVLCGKEMCEIYFSNDLYYAPEMVLTIK